MKSDKEIKSNPNFCPIPFLQLQLNPLGNVSACCFSNEHKVGNVRENTLEQIWNGSEMQKWRSEFINEDIKICKDPIRTFECQKMFQHLNDLAVLTPVQELAPRRLDLRLNGKCNLECIMCDVWSQPNGIYNESDFWTYGAEHIFPHLVEIDILGGEPFIQKDVYRVIEEISKVNPVCKFGFITNCSYTFNEQLRSYLDKIQIRHIHMSIDSLNSQTYMKIRKKGDLKKTLKTVESYVQYRNQRQIEGRPFTLFASLCVQKLNWMEIPDFLVFCAQHKIQPLFQSVIGREDLSLSGLDDFQLKEIQKSLVTYLDSEYRYAVLPVSIEIESILGNRLKK